MKRLILVFFVLASFSLPAQTPRQSSVLLEASVTEVPPSITLKWVKEDSALSYKILRRERSVNAFEVLLQLTKNDSTWTDTEVEVGKGYEYVVQSRIRLDTVFNYGYGFVYTGIKIPAHPVRGEFLLLVDAQMNAPLDAELRVLENDLWNEGWNVTRKTAPRTGIFNKDAVKSTKQIIRSWYESLNDAPATVLLFGRIAVPYSGMISGGNIEVGPDGHLDHIGAWAADTYYAAMGDENLWTDTEEIDTLIGDFNGDKKTDTIRVMPSARNYPDDGKFDNQNIPQYLNIRLGRVDLYDMGAYYKVTKMVDGKPVVDSLASERELLRNYLKRDHDYRTGVLKPQWRGLIDDNFGSYGEGFARCAWMSYPPLLGAGNIYDNSRGADWLNTLDTASYLWAYGCGGGTFIGAGGIGNSYDFSNRNLRTVFTMLFGSYFGDWDHSNNFLRMPLASSPSALTCCWGGRPYWYFHTMAMGETMGDAALISQNADPYYSQFYTQTMAGGYGAHVALMGDPSLRMSYGTVATPTALSAKQILDPAKAVLLKWTAPSGNVAGYFVYRQKTGEALEALNDEPITSTEFLDSNLVESDVRYIVRSVGLINSSVGTFYDISYPVEVSLHVTEVSENVNGEAPELQCYPNPANSSLSITAQLPTEAMVDLRIVDVQGHPVRSLNHSRLAAGEQKFSVDLFSDDGAALPSGIYVLRLTAGNAVLVKEFSIIR